MFDLADRILQINLTDICFNGPEETLKQTQYTQPALYVHSAAVSEILKEKSFDAHVSAGHSLGEISALLFAGAYTFEDGLRLVRERALLMQEAAARNPGSMAAIIGLEPDAVQAVCQDASHAGLVQPANFNSPNQIVISGTRSGVEAAIQLAKERGAKRAIPLPVSGGFHSPLMQSAADAFGDVLSQINIQTARIPVYANVTASAVTEPGTIQDLLKQQLTHSVRWIETIENMMQAGVTRFVEVGSGKVLGGLIKRIHPDAEIIACGTMEDLAVIGNG